MQVISNFYCLAVLLMTCGAKHSRTQLAQHNKGAPASVLCACVTGYSVWVSEPIRKDLLASLQIS